MSLLVSNIMKHIKKVTITCSIVRVMMHVVYYNNVKRYVKLFYAMHIAICLIHAWWVNSFTTLSIPVNHQGIDACMGNEYNYTCLYYEMIFSICMIGTAGRIFHI